MNESGDNNIINFKSRKQRWEQGWEDRRAAAQEACAKYLRNYPGGQAAFWRDFAMAHTGDPDAIVRMRIVPRRAVGRPRSKAPGTATKRPGPLAG
jgi:hypothetical protein